MADAAAAATAAATGDLWVCITACTETDRLLSGRALLHAVAQLAMRPSFACHLTETMCVVLVSLD